MSGASRSTELPRAELETAPPVRLARRCESWFTSSRCRTAPPSAPRPARPPPASASSPPRSTSSPTAATRRPACRPSPRAPASPPGRSTATSTRSPTLFAEAFRRAAGRELDVFADGHGRRRPPAARADRRRRRGLRPPRARRADARLRAAGRAGRPGRRGRAPHLPPRLPRRAGCARIEDGIARGELPAARHRDRRRRPGRRDRRGARRPALPRSRRTAARAARGARSRRSSSSALRLPGPSTEEESSHDRHRPQHADPSRSSTSRRRSRASTPSRRTGRSSRRSSARAPAGRVDRCATLGARPATATRSSSGRLANENPPVLKTHDRFGNRIDEVEFHPAWHELMEHVGRARHARAALARARPGRARRARRDDADDGSGVEAGHGCPISMTYAAVPGAAQAARAGRRVGAAPHVARVRRRALKPAEREARRALRHGDDRAPGRLRRAREHHARRAVRRRPGGEYELTGHKWFCSAPMCDAFLVLAQTRRRASPASCCRASRPTASATVPHQPAQGQARQPLERVERGRVRRHLGAASSARRAAASRRSSRWSTTRGSTACSARPG